MHPLKQLRRLLQAPQANSGKIVSLTATELQVATRRGAQVVSRPAGDVTNYAVGDSILLVNGQLVGRTNRTPTTYVL